MELNLKRRFSWILFLEGLTLASVIGGSSYLRFYDAFVNGSSSIIIQLRDTCLDEIYPWSGIISRRYLPSRILYLFGNLFKFAAVDALFILRYKGPFNTVLFTLGLYMVIRKLTNNGIGAIVAALIFGIYWVIMPLSPIEIDRQAATNAQEFAFVFIFPAIYFLIKYVTNKRKEDLL